MPVVVPEQEWFLDDIWLKLLFLSRRQKMTKKAKTLLAFHLDEGMLCIAVSLAFFSAF